MKAWWCTIRQLLLALGLSLTLSLGLSGVLGAQEAGVSPQPLARFTGEIDESSGLARHGRSLWTLNDSGNSPELYELNEQGIRQRSVRISNAENIDWESLAHDDDYLYVADTGNNLNSRDRFTIYRLSWEALAGDEVTADLITFSYADHERGNRLSHNFDAEGLAVRGDELWLFTKNRGDGRSNLYRLPRQPGHYRPPQSQSLPVNALVTAADIHPDTGELLLLANRRGADGWETILWLAPTSEHGVDWEQGRSVYITPSDQWEAVLWSDTAEDLFLTHENNERGYAGMARLPRTAIAPGPDAER